MNIEDIAAISIDQNGIAYLVFEDYESLDDYCSQYPHYFAGLQLIGHDGDYRAIRLGRLN